MTRSQLVHPNRRIITGEDRRYLNKLLTYLSINSIFYYRTSIPAFTEDIFFSPMVIFLLYSSKFGSPKHVDLTFKLLVHLLSLTGDSWFLRLYFSKSPEAPLHFPCKCDFFYSKQPNASDLKANTKNEASQNPVNAMWIPMVCPVQVLVKQVQRDDRMKLPFIY